MVSRLDRMCRRPCCKPSCFEISILFYFVPRVLPRILSTGSSMARIPARSDQVCRVREARNGDLDAVDAVRSWRLMDRLWKCGGSQEHGRQATGHSWWKKADGDIDLNLIETLLSRSWRLDLWIYVYTLQEFETHRVVELLVHHAERRRMLTTATVSAGQEGGATRSYSWPEVIVLVSGSCEMATILDSGIMERSWRSGSIFLVGTSI